MPYAGDVYSLPAGTAAANNTLADADDINSRFSDLEAAHNSPRPVSAGGTGATSESGARNVLGVAIGSDVQAYDAGLDDISGVTPDNGVFLVGDGTNWVGESGSVARTSLGIPVLLDEDDFASDSATASASQQSIKAYVGAYVDAATPTATTPVSLTGAATSQDGIPATATQFTVVISGMSTVASADFLVQVRVGAADVTTGYDSASFSNIATVLEATGMVVVGRSATSSFQGAMTFRKKPSSNVWIADHGLRSSSGGGEVDAGGVVSGVTVRTSAGDFDGGSFWILYS